MACYTYYYLSAKVINLNSVWLISFYINTYLTYNVQNIDLYVHICMFFVIFLMIFDI